MNSKLLVIFGIIIFQTCNSMQQSNQHQSSPAEKEYELPGREALKNLLLRNGYQKIVNYHFPLTEWSGKKVTCSKLAQELHRYRFLFVPPEVDNDTESFVLDYAPRLMDVLLSGYPEARADIDVYLANRKQYFEQERAQKLLVKS